MASMSGVWNAQEEGGRADDAWPVVCALEGASASRADNGRAPTVAGAVDRSMICSRMPCRQRTVLFFLCVSLRSTA